MVDSERDAVMQAAEDQRRADAARETAVAESYEAGAKGNPHEEILLTYASGYRQLVSNLIAGIPLARERAGTRYDIDQALDDAGDLE